MPDYTVQICVIIRITNNAMKTIIVKNYGGPEVLEQAELPKPVISSQEILVQVKALSINPVDVKTRAGKAMINYFKNISPAIIGWDISGVVAEIGAGVTDFRTGDEVFSMVNFPGYGKAYAEFVAAPASHFAHKPKNISHEEAAAATLAALTAWQGIVQHAKIVKGQRVLIHAASGGVGHYAVQIAKHFGAYVIGISSGANRDFVLNLGADEHIDYQTTKFETIVKDVDIVFDSLGAENVERSISSVKKGGTIISILGGFNEANAAKANEKGVGGASILVQSNGTDLADIAKLLESGKIKSYISDVFSFDDMKLAHEKVETNKTQGKVVVKL
jgi:NADPH:quinone reductase-like Zn-dependent oxidoreductase